MKTYLVKNFSLILAIVSSLIQIAIFTRVLDQNNLAYLMFIFGISNFAVFFDIASKPAYSLVKEKFNNANDWEDDIYNFTKFFFIQSLVFCIFFFLLILLTAQNFEHNFYFTSQFLLILSIAFIVLLSGIRVLFASMDMYLFGEVIEMFRRLLFLIAIFFLLLDPSLLLTASIMFLSTITLLIIMLSRMAKICNKKIIDFFRWKISNLKNTFNLIGINGINSVLILFSETVTYNIGYIITSFFGGPQSVIYFGIWQRLYLAGSMLGQVIPDILVHKITTCILKNESRSAKKLFYLSILSNFIIALSYFGLLTYFSYEIFNYWTDGQYSLKFFGFVALLFWLLSNAIQHTSGIFLAYHGKSFSQMKNISLTVALLITFFSSIIYFQFNDLNIFLISSGLIYFFGTLAFFIKANNIFKLTNDLQ